MTSLAEASVTSICDSPARATEMTVAASQELAHTISGGEAHLPISCLEKVGLECLKSHFLSVERFGSARSWAGSAAAIPDVFMTGWYDVRPTAALPVC
jgi:hypothetical protein